MSQGLYAQTRDEIIGMQLHAAEREDPHAYTVLIQHGGITVATAMVGHDARLRNVEASDPVWRQLLRALVEVYRDDPDLRTWLRVHPEGGYDVKKKRGEARHTHCKRGHELVAENVYVSRRKDGVERRTCRECMLARARHRWRMKVVVAWHGPCPNCGQTHNPDEIADACIDAITEAGALPALSGPKLAEGADQNPKEAAGV